MGAAAGAATGALLARADRAAIALCTWALAWLAYTALLAFPGLAGGDQGLTRPAVDHVQALFGLSLTLTPCVHVVAAALLCALACGRPRGCAAPGGRRRRGAARRPGARR